ncbi:QueT transporter family protein [Rubeoparvulum massiliense]|uniref:QueT transporter family protein n=1 Tax=Rubeoparvulum massiliense TaxID=1631346 RepID=UPI00065DD09B|nr:QueT transporter family protein [Rubeoparvulum massiliense]
MTTRKNQKWSNVDFVLIVVTAALYAVTLLITASLKIGPTPIRPANALQPVFGMFFGLPGSIGLAFGNLVNDMFTGMPPHAMILGFITNFLGGYIAYKAVSHPALATKKSWIEYYIFVTLIASAIIAGSVYINVWLGLTSPAIAAFLIPNIFLNQFFATAILGPVLIKFLYPFVKRSGLYRGRSVK